MLPWLTCLDSVFLIQTARCRIPFFSRRNEPRNWEFHNHQTNWKRLTGLSFVLPGSRCLMEGSTSRGDWLTWLIWPWLLKAQISLFGVVKFYDSWVSPFLKFALRPIFMEADNHRDTNCVSAFEILINTKTDGFFIGIISCEFRILFCEVPETSKNTQLYLSSRKLQRSVSMSRGFLFLDTYHPLPRTS